MDALSILNNREHERERLTRKARAALFRLPHRTALRIVQEWCDETNVGYLIVRAQRKWRKPGKDTPQDR